MRKKKIVDQNWKQKYCKSCIWKTRESLCPFHRCIQKFDWIANKRSGVTRNGKEGN